MCHIKESKLSRKTRPCAVFYDSMKQDCLLIVYLILVLLN